MFNRYDPPCTWTCSISYIYSIWKWRRKIRHFWTNLIRMPNKFNIVYLTGERAIKYRFWSPYISEGRPLKKKLREKVRDRISLRGFWILDNYGFSTIWLSQPRPTNIISGLFSEKDLYVIAMTHICWPNLVVRDQDEFGSARPDLHDERGENWISDNYSFSTFHGQNGDTAFTACLTSFTTLAWIGFTV